MKKSQIKIGKVYSNGKGRSRKVVDIGPEYKLYSAQESTENLRHEIVQDGTEKNRTAGEQHNITLVAFASWAKDMFG